ncbi:hypothetical protein TrLO_g5054 [Triparma laevis f. longispina]|uniref:CYRIA/CYRIB Rac1 binding domain-containing protein n=1 Tax=Triparma laevis f. longispina TaxID=1714387 RepID=A0A9W6ZH54_9STRA|nr:hypothetical protein TrLO_g5054 [Triparma laevis f. longispina]
MANVKHVVYPAVQSLLSSLPNSDPNPCVQMPSSAVTYESGPPANSLLSYDKRVFNTNYDTDLKFYHDAELYVEQGHCFCNMLYAFRSISRAIPTIKENDPKTKLDINIKTFEIIRPEMGKLMDLLNYVNATSGFIGEILSRLKDADSSTVREDFCEMLIKLIDVMQRIDNLKESKACLKNDFSLYKRSFTLARAKIDTAELVGEEINQLQMFLGNPMYPRNIIISQLNERVKGIGGCEDVLIEIMKLSCTKIEQNLYMGAEEKYCCYRALPYLLCLLDGGDKKTGFNAFKSKKTPLSRVQKILKNLPIVPQVGDIVVNLSEVLRLCPNFDPDKMAAAWGLGFTPQAVAENYSLICHWKDMRNQHTNFTTKMAKVLSDEKLDEIQKKVEDVHGGKVQPPSPDEILNETSVIYDTVFEGCKLLQNWTCHIIEMTAWKFQHPASDAVMKERGCEYDFNNTDNIMSMAYERVVRYNYNQEDLSVMVDCISMIKSLSAMLLEKEGKLAPVLRLYMHTYVQNFVSNDLNPLVQKADAKGKKILSFLQQIQGIVVDYLGSSGTSAHKSIRKAIKEQEKSKGGTKKFNARVVGPGSTQLHLLRVMLRSMNDGNGRGHYLKDIDKKTMPMLEAFHQKTHFFPHMSVLSSTIQQTNNLGSLWYRELHIEMTKCTQFPIEMSLPFLLSENIIHNIGDVPLVENVVFVMGLYNDAAAWALQTLQLQHLYDEIEAEVNLVFDQLVFLVADQMYDHYKNAASSTLLNDDYKKAIEKGKGYAQLTVNSKRFKTPASQRHVLLLGRSIDMNYLLASHINHKMSKDIESCIKRYENSDLSLILETEKMFEVIKNTHIHLSQILEIDSYEDMFKSVNSDVNAMHISGKVIKHSMMTVVEDLLPNYSFNIHTSRFIRSPIVFQHTGREKESKQPQGSFGFGPICSRAWDFYFRLSRGFIGSQHIDALVRLCDESGVELIMQACLQHVEKKLTDMQPYLRSLKEGLPPIILPKANYGTAAAFGFFESRLKQYFGFMDHLDECFRGFKEIGNVVAFCGMLEKSVAAKQCGEYINSASFLGVPCNLRSEYDGISNAKAGRKEEVVGDKREKSVPQTTFPVKSRFLPEEEARMSPFHRCMHVFVSATETYQVMPHVRAPTVTSRLLKMAKASHAAYDHLPYSQMELKIGSQLLDSIKAAVLKVGLDKDLEFDQGLESIMSTEKSTEFYRLFSVLNFLLCMEHKGRWEGEDTSDGGTGNESDPHVFGHGFAMCGSVFLHLFNQTSKFNMLDFSYHVIKVLDTEKISAELKSVRGDDGPMVVDPVLKSSSDNFVKEAKAQMDVHDIMFSSLNQRETRGEEKRAEREEKKAFTYFPPQDDRNIRSMDSKMKQLLHKKSTGEGLGSHRASGG